MNKFFALLVCTALVIPSTVHAEEDAYAPYLNPPSRQEAPVIDNQPVMGRIFGVQGSGADIDHYVVDLTDRRPSSAAVRSAVVPGWGQAFNNESGKGLLFFVTTVGLAAGSLIRYSASRDTYNDYKKAGAREGVLYDDYKDERTQALAMGGAALVLYTFGIIDAYNKAYKPLYSSDGGMNLALSPSETRVSWDRKF